jgi:amino acid transporter
MNDNEPKSAGRLGAWDAASIIIGIVIGTTIFELPWLIFANTPNPWAGLAVWVFGGLLALVGGLCYAELGATYPEAGGDYFYLREAFGRGTGFLFGWAQLILILPASIGLMAFVFAMHATALRPFPDVAELGLSSEFYYAAAAVLVIALLNLIGVTLGKTAQNILTAAKAIGLIAIIVCGLALVRPEEGGQTDWTFPATLGDLGWDSLAIILVLYAFGGWNDVSFVAAEVREPQRNIPRALLLGIGAITVIYLLVNLAYIVGLGFANARTPGELNLPTRLLHQAMGANGVLAMRVIIMVSALGALNGLTFAGSRVYATLGNDHRLFGFLGHWTPGRGAPILALLAQAIITLGLVLLFGTEKGHQMVSDSIAWINSTLTSVASKVNEAWEVRIDYTTEWRPYDAFDKLVSHSAPAFWLFFLLAGFSLFRLRDQNPNQPRPFSVPWYPLVPMIFCAMCVYMLYRSIIYIEWRTLFVVALLLVGVPLYLLSQALGEPQRASDAPPRGSATSKTVRGS